MTGSAIGEGPGVRIVQASWAGTAVFALTSVLGVVSPAAGIVALVVALGLFGAGVVVFLGAYARALSRSRTSQIGALALFFLEGCAPAAVRRHLLGAAGVQVAVALATATARPNTSVAFGILVPIYGVALAGLWGARHGTFPPRAAPSSPGRPEGRQPDRGRARPR